MANRCLLQQLNIDEQHQKRHLFPISFVSLNNPDFYTSHRPNKWEDLNSIGNSNSCGRNSGEPTLSISKKPGND